MAIRGTWVSSSTKLLIVSVYAPQDFSKRKILWNYIAHMIQSWEGKCVILGDFSEVRFEYKRFGTNFNDSGANAFNHFISSVGLIDLPLEGYSYTWALKSTSKMSKLDRFLILEGLLLEFPSLSALCLDRNLLDHRPIIMRENISFDQNVDLEINVNYEEIKCAVWDCGTNKSLRPDGFTFEFFCRYWNIINQDVMNVVQELFASADLGASINLMLYSLYAKLSIETLKPTKMSVRLADKSFQYPVGIAGNMLIEVGKFTFPADFVILEMEEDSKVPLIFGRPFLHAVDAVIRVKQKQLNLRVGTERMIFNIGSAMKHSYSNDDTCFNIDVIEEILEEDFNALLDEESEILHSIKGTILEEKLFTEFDEFMAMTADENSESEFDTEEPSFETITFNTDYKIKTSLEEPPTDLELKPLPDNLEYVFLKEPFFLPVIISSQLSEENKNKLKQDAKPRLIRLILPLQEFDIEVKDRKGIENVAADHLSRIEYDETRDDSEVNDNFPGKTLMEINTEDEPRFADFANYLVSDIIPKGRRTSKRINFSLISNNTSGRNPTSSKNSFLQQNNGKTMKRYGVNHRFSTSYHPQMSGLVENMNRAHKRILEKTVKDNPAMWSRKLDDTLWAFCTAYKTPTGTTPYKLVYGKNYHLPFEIEHRAFWALKNFNLDLIAAGEKRMF
uniref:Reverse transcriptase domain-containing protein n=1 Tax=Tanacetum cinerariifolium TaxID=118510 RepID=A0A699GXM6_TANCI|nr:reverse transcriptase domain-containing protein [Tanacetum cinerariifolium]